ncbi:MAG: class I adenylate-forming enzyme family protein [Pseudomonadota bacterium]|nr:class I adenylate-forming enzyme family protein [Pseudomonadota bacterium]
MNSWDHAPRHNEEQKQQYIQQNLWNDDTIATYLENWARETPDHPAIVAGGRSFTYAETRAAARRFANSLLDLGLGKGDVVGIQLPNLPEYLIAYFGVSMMGGILGTLHMPYRAAEMEPLMNHGRMRALICGAATERYDAPETARELKSRVPTLEHIIVLGDAVPDDCRDLTKMIAAGSDDDIADPPGPDDFALLCFTSGTAAAPKAVVRDYRSITANARIYSPTINLTAEDVVMTAPPFTHVFGLCCVACTLWAGATSVLMDLFTPDSYIGCIEQGRPSIVFCAPAHIAATHKAGLFDGRDCSSIREVIVAGAVCPPDVAATFERYLPNGRVGQLFGMTEVILTMQTPLDVGPEIRHASTGRVTIGIEARVTGPDDDAPLGPGEEGELEIRGYSVLAGYLKNDDANRESFTPDGYFRTGDLATIDSDGNVVITGRVKHVINRGGIKINPTDIENLITAHEAVVQAAIVARPDDVYGEKACLFVELVPDGSIGLDEMTAHLEENGVAKMRWPERLEIVDEMPMTPTRKIIKDELAKLLN